MIDNTYDRFMIQSEEGRRRTIVDSDDKTFDDDNPLFCRINGAPRCGIYLHATPTKNRSKKRDGKETKYLLQGKCKVCRKKTTPVCSDCADIDAFKNEMWVCHPKTKCYCFYIMYISYMNLSAKYIIIKSCLFLFLMPLMYHYC